MQDFIGNVTEFFTGGSNAPANPDIAHNIYLLNQTKAKIETGIFTRLFKKPFIIAGESLAYISTIVLLLLGIFVWNKFNTLITVIEISNSMQSIFTDAKWDNTFVSLVDALLFVICAMPAVICFLLGRLLTNSRRRINTFMEVEHMIDRVIFNLENK